MTQLGGHAISLGPSDVSMGKRESVADIARTLSGMADASWRAPSRTRRSSTWRAMPRSGHQRSFGPPATPASAGRFPHRARNLRRCEGIRLAYVGDGKQRRSLADVRGREARGALSAWRRRRPTRPIPRRGAGRQDAAATGASIAIGHDVAAAVAGAMSSTPTPGPAWDRRRSTTKGRKSPAVPGRCRGHGESEQGRPSSCTACRPIGREVTDEVIESKASVVFLQAANRPARPEGRLDPAMGGVPPGSRARAADET